MYPMSSNNIEYSTTT